MCLDLFYSAFWISTEVVYLQRCLLVTRLHGATWNCWCHVWKLMYNFRLCWFRVLLSVIDLCDVLPLRCWSALHSFAHVQGNIRILKFFVYFKTVISVIQRALNIGGIQTTFKNRLRPVLSFSCKFLLFAFQSKVWTLLRLTTQSALQLN